MAADGRLVASRGERIDLTLLRELAAKAPRGVLERPLYRTMFAEPVLEAFEEPALQCLTAGATHREEIAEVLAEVRFPEAVWEELAAVRSEDWPRYQHAIWTAAISTRLFRAALGPAPALPRLAGAALVHDVGMRHVSLALRLKRGHLTPAEALELERHPLVGALLLASVLGDDPAVRVALLHHTPAGLVYGQAGARRPLREVDLISVASAFAALTAPRFYRLRPFSPRGAVDQLLEDSMTGRFDPRAIRLLIRCLRGSGRQAKLQFPRRPTGFRPPVNHHGICRRAARRFDAGPLASASS